MNIQKIKIELEQQERELDKEFLSEYHALCEKYERHFVAQILIRGDRIIPELVVYRNDN